MHKYGGAALKDIEALKKVAAHLKQICKAGDQVLCVVSAMGQQTDDLHEKALAVHPSPPKRELDMLVTTGERVSMALLSIALHAENIKALSLTGSQSGILTDSNHGNAKIIGISSRRIEDSLKKAQVVIIAGFQGMCPKTKEITTLGRGGSDLTAMALAIKLKAKTCELYKTVKGVLSADPQKIPSAKTLAQISPNHLLSLCLSGAQIVHHRAVALAAAKNLSFAIKDVNSPEKIQSLVTAKSTLVTEKAKLIALSQKDNLRLVKIKIMQDKMLKKVSDKVFFTCLNFLHLEEEEPLIAQQFLSSESLDMTLSLTGQKLEKFKDFFANFASNNFLTTKFIVDHKNLSSLCLLGLNLRQDLALLKKLQEELEGDFVFFEAFNQHINLLVPQEKATLRAQKIHEKFILAP